MIFLAKSFLSDMKIITCVNLYIYKARIWHFRREKIKCIIVIPLKQCPKVKYAYLLHLWVLLEDRFNKTRIQPILHGARRAEMLDFYWVSEPEWIRNRLTVCQAVSSSGIETLSSIFNNIMEWNIANDIGSN